MSEVALLRIFFRPSCCTLSLSLNSVAIHQHYLSKSEHTPAAEIDLQIALEVFRLITRRTHQRTHRAGVRGEQQRPNSPTFGVTHTHSSLPEHTFFFRVWCGDHFSHVVWVGWLACSTTTGCTCRRCIFLAGSAGFARTGDVVVDTHTLEEDCGFFAFVDTWEEFRVFASFVTENVGKIRSGQ